MATIQVDLVMLPERFDLTYIDEDGQPQRPIAIHRAIYGSLERFIGILVEHFAGAFPLWLAPVQAVVIPIADRHIEAAEEFAGVLRSRGLRVEVDALVEPDAVQDPDGPGAEGAVHGRAGRPRDRGAHGVAADAGRRAAGAAGLGGVRRPPGGGVASAVDRLGPSAAVHSADAASSASVSRPLVVVDVAVKVATIGLLAWAVLNPDLPQLSGKAFTARAVVYPIALVVLPIGWWLLGRARMAFPVVADILLGLPFLIDVAGNALDLYDTIAWWDDANHLAQLGPAHRGDRTAAARRAVGVLDSGGARVLLGGDDGRAVGTCGVRHVRARLPGGRDCVRRHAARSRARHARRADRALLVSSVPRAVDRG